MRNDVDYLTFTQSLPYFRILPSLLLEHSQDDKKNKTNSKTIANDNF